MVTSLYASHIMSSTNHEKKARAVVDTTGKIDNKSIHMSCLFGHLRIVARHVSNGNVPTRPCPVVISGKYQKTESLSTNISNITKK